MNPQVCMLGALSVREGASWHEPPSHKTVALLAYLAFHGGWVDREVLAALFWPEAEEAAARTNLRSLLSRSRDLGWAEGLEAEDGRVRWDVACDVHLFRAAVAAGRWDEAVELYRGDLLEGATFPGSGPFTSWLQIERENLREAFRSAAMRRVRAAVAAGQHDDAVAQLTLLLARDPLDEDAVRLGMDLHARAGRPAQALRIFEAFRDRLGRELDLEPATPTTALARSIRDAPAGQAAPDDPPLEAARLAGIEPPVDAASDALEHAPSEWAGVRRSQRHGRVPLTSFIGRDAELSELRSRLERPECRLVTVVGTGGVGKTRLALRTAEIVADRYPEGTFVVTLEDTHSSQGVAAAIGSTFGTDLRGRIDPISQLADAVGDAQALLVLDNFEHVLDAAPVVAGLLDGCPRLDILVTSRERLDLPEEWLLPLRGLDYPQEDAALANAQRADAIRCLVGRIRQVRPDFVLDEGTLPDVVRVCRLVEGLPLGLELAAVWARAMTIEEIATEIERNLDFLRQERRGSTGRHQSVRATFEHSWRLLSEVERDTLRKLAVFRGGFRRSAAAFVANASIAVLAALVDKSLLRASLDGRYDRHPLVHALTREKLAEQPEEADRARERHARYFAWLLDEAEPHRGSERQTEWKTRLEPDADNLAAALAHAVERRDGDLALRLLPSMRWRGWPDGQVDERNRIVAQVLALDAPERHPMRKHALHIAGVLAVNLRRYDDAGTYYRQALALTEASEDQLLAPWLRTNLATLAMATGDAQAARVHLEACLAERDAFGVHTGIASALNHLGAMERSHGNHDAARAHHQNAFAIGRATHDTLTICRALNGLGYVAQARGDHGEARARLTEGLAVAERHKHHASAIAALHALGETARVCGDLDESRDLHGRGLELARATGTYRLLHRALEGVGDLLAVSGRHREAARAWGAAGGLRNASGVRGPELEDERQGPRDAARACAGGPAFDAAFDAGRGLDASAAIAAAREALGL